ncbi:response regulator transcription factor [Pedobacter sp. ISL-68]|uniref:response regulator transcription factor n=1 Tax=unclassified Pedobacter TaxID=2628915 RepID=UPI001BECE7E1|nr:MULTISPECIES: response regulator [unclassified Pedobacter]MBT2560817.1 response regulator transcription factor [Pedobacter sp. ISL-64]MBT2590196.1 response regulator transcription factor [Pedobacter sp. ISL-68]
MDTNMHKEIYILEDDKDIGFILNHLLLDEGYQVYVFETVTEFRKALVTGRPDLLLMDVRLPDGNGLELCAEIKSAQKHDIPVLMMSADWPMHDHKACQADAYIAKPFDIGQVVSKIGEYF